MGTDPSVQNSRRPELTYRDYRPGDERQIGQADDATLEKY